MSDDKMRAEFEAVFPVPEGAFWDSNRNGNEYTFNGATPVGRNWDDYAEHQARWEGWQAACEQQQAGEPVAWMNPDNGEVISDAEKRTMEHHNGVPGKKVAKNYSQPLAKPQPQPDWVRCSERFATIADQEPSGLIWICSPIGAVWAGSYGDLRVSAAKDSENWWWAQLITTRPQPPEDV